MAKQTINIGAAANDGTGDPIRTAFGKVNDNFTEIYTANTGTNTGDQNLAAYATTAAVAAGYQPLDSDLTAIAALTTTAYGRALLSTADAPTLRTAIGLGQTDAPTFLAQTLTGQSLTGTQATSLVDLATTWNTTGNPSLIYGRVVNTNSGTTANLIDLGTFAGGSLFKVDKTGVLTLPVGSATSTAIRFGTQGATTGLFSSNGATAPGIGLAISGTSYIYSGDSSRGLTLHGNWPLSWAHASASDAPDLFIQRDAAGILAQRNGSAIQTLRIYNTYTDATNYSRLKIGYEVANYAAFVIAGEQLGTGGGRNLALSGNGNVFGIGTAPNGNFNWVINGGNLLAGVDNIHDIGASGANRPKTIYAGSGINAGTGSTSVFQLANAVAINLTGGSYGGTSQLALFSPSDGVLRITNGATTDLNRLQLGGTTSAFPAIKRNGTGVDIRLADDSAFAPISSLYQRFGSGSPESVVTAPMGATYHRTDGGSGSSYYVKESGSGANGWVGK